MKIAEPVFVFGSNLAGRHGAGAARHALDHCGAIYGQGVGPQGRSYAIPTKDGRGGASLRDPAQTLDLITIATAVSDFLAYAASHLDDQFKVTAIGCGLAGYAPNQISPMFRGATENVILPPEFQKSLGVRIAVTGGRDYRNKARVWRVLDAAIIRLGMTSGMDGGAPGADLHARMWADHHKFLWHTEKAKWHVYRRAAGPIRNQVMINMRPDIVIAFPGNDGTADMVRQAEATGIRVIRIDW